MSQFLIEQIRYLHEEIELIEKAIAELIENKVENPKKKLLYDYSINYLLDKIQNKSKLLLQLYDDEDNLKKEEMQFISGKTSEEKNDIWKNYYERIKYIKDYHKKTNIKKIEIRSYKTYINEALSCNNLKESFSPVEKKGKYVDMNTFYNDFINMKKIKEFRINVFKKKEMAKQKKKNYEKQSVGNVTDENEENRPNGLKGHTENVEQNEKNKNKKKNINYEKNFVEMDFCTYLKNFTRFYYIPRYCKYHNDEYKNYLDSLLNYLFFFFKRINVLADCDKTHKQYEKEFKEKFINKEIIYWEKYTYELDFYCNINNKLYASEGTYNGYLKSKNYNKDLEKYMKNEYTVDQLNDIKKEIEKQDEHLAKCEYLIEKYKNVLHKIFQKTVQNIQRKQAFTIHEIEKYRLKNEKKNEQLSIQDEHSTDIYGLNISVAGNSNSLRDFINANMLIPSDDSSSSSAISDMEINEQNNEEEDDTEQNKPIYNPLNLPLGPDNKPIPYWLYKLHGLSKEYKCEICGNYSYFGRAMFEKHFYEWRHSFGMKCLNIPNTLHFKEITKIEDALNLYEKLKKQTQDNLFKPDQEIECEDSKGNVMNIKAYDDLKRQGLL
ncbi:splicing factor 3A subunit 3, putative [Hepatocystis sp. ex Piliocolobus tephrosceles]|nr:splicing factor 3A subunit 3, putative [Hepatocystis sp. ex Piliocolobus tephrosceles]